MRLKAALKCLTTKPIFPKSRCYWAAKEHKMNVLVTGGTGFTGSHLVQRLLSRGHTVTVLDNQEGIVLDALTAAGAKVALGSVTDEKRLWEAVSGQEVIFHLAAAFRRAGYPVTCPYPALPVHQCCLRDAGRYLVPCQTI